MPILFIYTSISLHISPLSNEKDTVAVSTNASLGIIHTPLGTGDYILSPCENSFLHQPVSYVGSTILSSNCFGVTLSYDDRSQNNTIWKKHMFRFSSSSTNNQQTYFLVSPRIAWYFFGLLLGESSVCLMVEVLLLLDWNLCWKENWLVQHLKWQRTYAIITLVANELNWIIQPLSHGNTPSTLVINHWD